MEHSHSLEMTRALDALIERRLFDCMAVFLFGHCNAAETMADYLLAHNISIIGILDNSESKQGHAYRDIPILPPEWILKYKGVGSIVLIASRFYAEMSAQLRRIGYDGEIARVVEQNSFAEYSLQDETFKRKTARAIRGTALLERIRERYPSRHLVICPNKALGDVYWAMAFLPAYCKKRDIAETAVVVIGNACREVAGLFAAKDIVALRRDEMDELVQAVIFTREENCIIAHHDLPYTDNIIRYLDKRFLSFVDYYRRAVYGLDAGAPPAIPNNFAPFDNREQIPKGKAIILSPYAKSVVAPPKVFWANIAAEYAKRDCRVYTNTAGAEAPICGTEPLYVPISQLKSAVEHAGVFIGLRNGLCDALHTAKCRKIVVFPDCYYSTTPHKVENFFALPEWEKMIYSPIIC